MVKYKVLAKPGFEDIQTPAQGQKFIDRLRDEVFPMLDKWWVAYGMRETGRMLDINLLSFVQTWAMGSTLITMAYEDDKPVGVLIGLRYSHLFYTGATMQVIALYGDKPEVEQGLLDYVSSLIPAMSIDTIAIDSDGCKDMAVPGMEKKRVERLTYWR